MESSPLNDGNLGSSYTDAKSEEPEDESAFICNVCLDITNKDPVVTQCGHLYCWPCLYRWLNSHQNTCPVCKAGVTKENVIPLYIRGNHQDPRNNVIPEDVPNRPAGRRPEPQNQGNAGPNAAFNNMGLQMGGMTFTVGFGFFPSLFGLQFQGFTGPPRQSNQNRQRSPEEIQQEELSKALIMLGSVVLMALLFF